LLHILVEAEHLRALSIQWRRNASELRNVGGYLSSALSSLDWEIRQRAGVAGEWDQGWGLTNTPADQAETLAHHLTTKAQTLKEADRASATALGEVVRAFAPAAQQWTRWWYQAHQALAFPEALLGRWLCLWRVIQDVPVIWAPALGDICGLMRGPADGYPHLAADHARSAEPAWTNCPTAYARTRSAFAPGQASIGRLKR